jgi:hypothetical protein
VQPGAASVKTLYQDREDRRNRFSSLTCSSLFRTSLWEVRRISVPYFLSPWQLRESKDLLKVMQVPARLQTNHNRPDRVDRSCERESWLARGQI